MEEHGNVAIFWDFENCRPGSSVTGYEVVKNIRRMAQTFGSVRLFKAYLDVAQQTSLAPPGLRIELQISGVSLTDCPHNGIKSVAEKMLIVDMIAYIIDNPAPTTLVLISGDPDYSYAVSILRLRRYRVVVICPPGTRNSLTAQASVHLDWNGEVLGQASLEDSQRIKLLNQRSEMTPSRKRTNLTASQSYTPSMSKTRHAYDQRDGVNKDDVHLHDTSTRVSRPSPPPSRTNMFDPARSSPSIPPLTHKTPEPTFGSSGGGMYRRSFALSLPKDFSFFEPEPISLKSPEAGPSLSNVDQSVFVQKVPEKAPPRQRSASLFSVFTPGSTPTAAAIPTTVTLAPTLASVPSPALPLPPLTLTSVPAPAPAPTPTLEPITTPAPAPASATPPTPPPAHTQVPAPTLTPPTSAPAPALQKMPFTFASNSSKPPLPMTAVPPQFEPLVARLELRRQTQGHPLIPRSDIATYIATKHKNVYTKAGVSTFDAYIGKAVKAEIVKVGGVGNYQWISLRPGWSDA